MRRVILGSQRTGTVHVNHPHSVGGKLPVRNPHVSAIPKPKEGVCSSKLQVEAPARPNLVGSHSVGGVPIVGHVFFG